MTFLKALLKKNRIKEVALAKRLQMSRATLSLYVNSWQRVPLSLRSRIAQILNCPVSRLFDSEGYALEEVENKE